MFLLKIINGENICNWSLSLDSKQIREANFKDAFSSELILFGSRNEPKNQVQLRISPTDKNRQKSEGRSLPYQL